MLDRPSRLCARPSILRALDRHRTRLEVERLEARDLPTAYALTLSAGGQCVVAQDARGFVTVREGGIEIFSRDRLDVSELRIAGTAQANAFTIDFAGTAPGFPLLE